MRRQTSFSRRLVRALSGLLLLLLAGYVGYQAFLYYQVRDLLPAGMEIAGIDVGGLTLEQAREQVAAAYSSTIYLVHRDEQVEMEPAQVGFQLDLDGMLQEAAARQQAESFWQGLLVFMMQRPVQPAHIELRATHDRQALEELLQVVAGIVDTPVVQPSLVPVTHEVKPGSAGTHTDIAASLPAVEAALYRLRDRRAELVVSDDQPEMPGLFMLQDALEKELATFDGMGSVFVLNLETGEEISINADQAMSGLSIVKIAIMLDTFRAIDQEPLPDQLKLLSETAILSGNYSANLLLDIVAGQDNAYLGVDIVTETMQQLGLKNTFIATPYEEPERPGRLTYATEANTSPNAFADLDRAMQTTAEDIGTLLSMIYYCSQGGGPLLALYPGQLTPAECRQLLHLMSKNVEGNLIRYGVPQDVVVSHKHGWAGGTHGDAGIVFSPNVDYVVVTYLYQPGGWLVADYSFPILRELSRTVYNYFNPDAPYMRNAFEQRLPSQEVTPTSEDGQG